MTSLLCISAQLWQLHAVLPSWPGLCRTKEEGPEGKDDAWELALQLEEKAREE